MLALLAHPEQERRVRADRSLVPALVEETLRWASPVQFAPRRATRAATLHGVALAPDDIVLCWIGSANRDERVFERADVFDPARARAPHIAFGFGPHYCLGANLARLEASLALDTLLARTKGMEAGFASARRAAHPSEPGVPRRHEPARSPSRLVAEPAPAHSGPSPSGMDLAVTGA